MDEAENQENQDEIKLTYETLYELVRREKSRDELQELMPDFYKSVLEYIKEKREMLVKSVTGNTASECNFKVEQQVNNIKKLVRDLYDKRERKICNLAIMKVRTVGSITDFSSMLPSEKRLFDNISRELEDSRKEWLDSVLFERITESMINKKVQQEETEQTQEEESPEMNPETKNPESEQQETEITSKKTVEIIAAVPKFVGKNLEKYGPYGPGESVELPADIADILIRKGKAKES